MKQLFSLLLCGAAVVISGCPQGEVPLPPFDATGGYGGTFEATSNRAPSDLLTCRIAFDLRHDPEEFFPLSFKLDGTVALNFTCASTLNALADLDIPSLLGVEIAGALTEEGTFSVIGAAEREDRTYGIALDGTGSDLDGNGWMDVMEGTFTFVVFDDTSSAFEVFELTGTYSAALPEEAAFSAGAH